MKIKIACGQMEVIPANPAANTKSMLSLITEAKKQDVDILLFPEMSIPGYLLGDLWEQESFLYDCEAYGKEVIAASEGITVIFGNVGLVPSKVNQDGHMRKYNAAFVAQDGKLVSGGMPESFISKTCLPNYREFDDARYFHSTVKFQQELRYDLTLERLLQPVKVTIHNKEVHLGIMLCEDGWTEHYYYKVPEILAKNGADILLNISCSPFTLGKNSKRHRLFGAQANKLHLPLIYCNAIGVQNNGKNLFTFDGSSTVYNKEGEIVAETGYFSQDILCASWDYKTGEITALRESVTPPTDIEAIYQATVYGAKHFLAQTGIKKMTIGLSGGIDSAVTAAFYVHLLGPENVLLLNLPSKFNSETTKGIALYMAKTLKTNYAIMPIEDSVTHTIEQLSTTPIHNYGTNKDTTLTISSFAAENIQARDRGARLIAGAAASFGGAFSCNSNKSELTVGYATFYGDIAGCLAVLGDLWKHQVYALGRYLNEEIFHENVIPEEVFTIAPSAELSAAQTVGTGGDPLIYPYHDYLFRSFIERWQKASPEDILTWYKEGTLEKEIGCEEGLVAKLFATPADFIQDLERWWNLFSGLSIAKRIQAPPVLAISRRAYGYDHREAQLKPYYSRKYLRLKEEMLK